MHVRDKTHIAIGGYSAGGGLCMALLLLLRDEGLPMPAGAYLISPWVDLTHSFPLVSAVCAASLGSRSLCLGG